MREKVEIALQENGETLKFIIEKMPAYPALLWKKRAFSNIDLEKIISENKTPNKLIISTIHLFFYRRIKIDHAILAKQSTRNFVLKC